MKAFDLVGLHFKQRKKDRPYFKSPNSRTQKTEKPFFSVEREAKRVSFQFGGQESRKRRVVSNPTNLSLSDRSNESHIPKKKQTSKLEGKSASEKPWLSGTMKVNEKQSWAVSPSDVAYHFGTSGLSVAVATAVTHPLDVLKVRLQMQHVGHKGPLVGMGRLFLRVFENEGPRFLYLGLTPALTRSVLYGGLRLGLYEPSKYACNWAFGSNNVFVKIASAGFGGAVATALTNPVEVLKVRLQMNPNLSKGGPTGELHRIISEEGVKALWKGVGPAMARAATLTASQLATYDETKRMLIRWTKLEEGFHLHLISSTVAGATSTLITAPVDMIKTRLMLQQEPKRVGSYKNGFHCAYQVMRTEGPRGLYKGSLAMFARLGPQTTITFILCEKLRELAGLKAI